ncbi:LSU ribosomal protein L1P [Giardia duodenalis]|nr:LSU ribosomal protein L1P [Giardia intestinalis]BAD10935.1 ribosomal protein L10a [Giardia intestinalis]|eukprot:XP_001707575.1 Ribosomal protein L10a [Giardia lamblia ATCC 50803]
MGFAMQRINPEALNKHIAEIIERATNEKPRKFLETVELQVGLKGYDPKKDPRFNLPLVLPHIAKQNLKLCVIADARDADRAKKLGLNYVEIEHLQQFNKDAKQIKKFAKSYDVFLASKSLIRQITVYAGPGFTKAGRTPLPLAPDEDLELKVLECKSTIKVQFKKAVGLNWPIGNVKMPASEIAQNIMTTLNFLATQLKKGWQNIKTVYIKSTMGPSHRIF